MGGVLVQASCFLRTHIGTGIISYYTVPSPDLERDLGSQHLFASVDMELFFKGHIREKGM